MMKLVLLTLLCWTEANKCTPTSTFHRQPLFGIRGGESKSEGDYDRAEKAIFHGMQQVEARLEKAVEEEVHAIFDQDHPHAAEIVEHAKAAVKRGSEKVKKAVEEHSKFHFFLPEHAEGVPHEEHRILHAVEAAETAVLNAVQDEVETLFHPTHDENHPIKDEKQVKKVHEVIKKGVKKAKKDAEEHHEVRRKWMHELNAQEIDEYLKSVNNMFEI